ncbi:MAG: VanW family protein, partial [Roseiflexaceae bacterium]
MIVSRALVFLAAPLVVIIALLMTSSGTPPTGLVALAGARTLLKGSANAPLAAPSRYVTETGHNLGGPFQSFFAANGGAALFGNPLTDQLTEDGLMVQYFERARLELHPDGNMTLTRLGALLTEGRTDTPFEKPVSVPPDRVLVPESGHSIGGVLRSFWEQEGGITFFGNPISEEFIEQIDGKSMLVQYFERSRLEYLPIGNGGDGTLRIGALGTLYAQRVPQELRAPARPIVILGESQLSYAMGTPEAINIALAAAQFDGLVVYPGYSLSYLDVVGEVSPATGYQGGQSVVGGVVVDSVGGGICMVSTVLYRAAFYAGLEILSQRNHS